MKKHVALLLAGLAVALAGCGREEIAPAVANGPDALAATGAPATASASVRADIEAKTSALRGLKFQRPVDYRRMPRPEFKEFLLRKVAEQYTAQELGDYGRALAALGAIPRGTDLLAVMLSLYDEQVAAFYVPEERALYTFTDSTWSGGLDRMLLAHELTHALQDQNYDLTKMPLKEKHNDDLALAVAALLEGDATILMTRYFAENADRSRLMEDLGAMMGQQTGKLAEAPAFLRDTLLFPYVQGQSFVQVLYQAGDLKALDAAFRHPPISTEEVLHPELFLRRDRQTPSAVTPPAFLRAGYKQIADNVLGEFGIRSLLQQEVGAFQAQVAAAGWDGDRYHAYAPTATDGDVVVVWRSAWDTEEDAVEFAEAYEAFAQKRQLRVTLVRQARQVTITIGARDAGNEEPARP